MSAVATWADKVRFTKYFAWTEPMHYVDIRDDLILPNGCPSTSTPLSSISSNTANDVTKSELESKSESRVKIAAFASENPSCVFIYSRDCDDGLCTVNAIQQMSNNLHNANQNHDHVDRQKAAPLNSNEFLPILNHRGKARLRTVSKVSSSMNEAHNTNFTTRQSLMFLIHFVGDIHQPLHVSRKSDIGGNKIHVSFPKPYTYQNSFHSRRNSHHYHSNNDKNKPYPIVHITHKGWNLHSVWDSGMIEYIIDKKFNHSQSDYQSFIEDTFITKKNIDQWWNNEKSCVNDDDNYSNRGNSNGYKGSRNETCVAIWAEESWNDALEWAYGNEKGHDIHDGDSISDEYIISRLRIVEMRLAAAGVRLASVLEMLYSPHHLQQQE